ncbi:related to multidrug resistant [Lecanosticta acicola]|uniref:Cercosporin MFS transporter CTB4 n=1 Tax=Lecanosticta acicola TaxID=111012 RepID=A0AAI8Z4B0_9PEZI|nr:related to multidrug resistant [Lecanosticta acicola]
MSQQVNDERRPLLENQHQQQNVHAEQESQSQQQQPQQPQQQPKKISFQENDPSNPRNWPSSQKWLQVLQIVLVAFVCPSASSIFATAITEISQDLNTTTRLTLLGQTGFVCMLGIGPLFLAPMSETLGRRPVFLMGLAGFTILQIPTALVKNLARWAVLRTLAGFFGSVGVANGGGSISDMFETHKRAIVLGVYLVAPLLGPSIGPLVGGLIVAVMDWRWIFWVMFIASAFVTVLCYFTLYETRALTILEQRKRKLERENPETKYEIEGDQSGNQSLLGKIGANSTRAIRILTTQPIVMIMSLYQALVFSSMYSLYSQYSTIWSAPPYEFSTMQIGLAYLGPAIGFCFTAIFIVLFIDRLYRYLAKRHGDEGQPEYRLPMANVGAFLLPISLFWFGWTIEKDLTWPVPLAATLLFGASQVSIFNTIQTYYIDAYEQHAASAVAAGAFLRSVVGGIVPLFVGGMFDALGYGWGMSVFGILSVILMPAPAVFYWVGRRLREKVPFKG